MHFQLYSISCQLFQDQVIIPLTSSAAKGDETEDEDPLLVVHPNYVVDV